MKQIIVDCDYCGVQIQPSHLFTRHESVFYHTLCFELYVVECVEKVRLYKQTQESNYATRQ